jgi:phosphatidylglycerophosphate synthase
MNTNSATNVVAPERRPMFARDMNLLKLFARWLVARKVSPNAISLAGMAGAILSGLALAATTLPGLARLMFFVAAAGIIVRALGNLLDGMVAVGTGKASPLGELFNEVPDRVSDIAILIGVGFAVGGNVTLGLLAALVAVLVAYVRAEGKVVGAAQHYCGPMAKPGRMLVIFLAAIYCGLTPANWQPAWNIGAETFGLMAVGLIIIVVGGIATAIRRLNRIAKEAAKSYALKK